MRIYSVHDYSVDYKKCAQELFPKNDNNNARGFVIFVQESDLKLDLGPSWFSFSLHFLFLIPGRLAASNIHRGRRVAAT